MTRRRAFWPGQSGQSVPPGFLGDDDGEGRSEPAVRWRAVDHPLYPDDVEHGAPPAAGEPDEPDDFARYDRYGRYDDDHLFATGVAYGDDEDDDLRRYEVEASWYDSDEQDRPVGLYRFDDYAHPDGVGGTDPTEPGDGVLRDGGVRNDAASVLRAMLVDRDDDGVEPQKRRGPRGQWRLTLAERLVAAWPGQSEEGAPPGFPASGELVLRPPSTGSTRSTGSTGSTVVRLPVRSQPVVGTSGEDEVDESDPDTAAELSSGETPRLARGRFGGRRTVADDRSDRSDRAGSVPGLPSPRSLQKVAMAVYAALADPIVNADPEARERRTVQVRRFGMLAGSAALAVVLIYAIFPVRTYLEQRAATQRARERIDKLSEANAELEQRKEQLRDDETVEEIARRDYQLVFPGEESYGLLPPPVAPTTTTTTPPGG